MRAKQQDKICPAVPDRGFFGEDSMLGRAISYTEKLQPNLI